MKTIYPWEKPARRVLFFGKPRPSGDALRKARASAPHAAFNRVVDLLSTTEGRVQYRRLLRDLANGVQLRRAPRIVGVAR